MIDKFYLRTSGITKDFTGVVVLRNIDLEIQPGKIYSLAGENGAGKSTLCNIISGGLKPSSGSIITPTGKYDHLTLDQAKEMKISMVHQELQMLPDLSIAENIFVGNEVQNKGWIKKKEMMSRTQHLLDMVGLDVPPDTLVRDIDIAARQLVEIARANSSEAKLIILDEPTSSLSDKEVKKLFDIMNTQKQMGTSFIFISHRLEELLEISDEIVILKDGSMVAKLRPEETDETEIINLMVGRSYTDYYNRHRTVFGSETLRVEHLSGVPKKSVANAYIPQDVSFRLEEGEVLGLAGLVGAGRTEVVKLLFGEEQRADGATIYVAGEKTKINDVKSAMDCGIVWITEDRKNEGLILDFNIKQNMVIPILDDLRKKIFVDTKKELEIEKEYIEKLQIKTTSSGQIARTLSGGNQQKVVISKWLATKPKILIMDEPTRGIDVGAKAEIYKLINFLTGEGISVLLISSEMPEIMGMSDRIMVMYEGRIAGELKREDFSEENIMTYAMGRKLKHE